MKDPQYNLAIFGHAKHGKSTLGGRLAYEFGAVSDDELLNFEIHADRHGKDFNKYNSIFLQRNPAIWQKESNELGDASRTSYPEFSNLKINNNTSLTLVDTPGHRDYISNLIYGVYLADQAIITIAANTGLEDVTLEVLKSLMSFDIPILAIAITKMDIVNYSETIYNEIIGDLRNLLDAKFDIKIEDLCNNIVPISVLHEVGLKNTSSLIEWYKGETLVEIIEKNKFTSLDDDLGARFTVEGPKDIYNIESTGVVAVGTLECGNLSKNDILTLEPASTISGKNISYKIKSIQQAKSVTDKTIDKHQTKFNSRSILSILFSNISYFEISKQLKRGGVFGRNKIQVANRIIADIRFFETEKIYQGMEFILHTNASYSKAKISKFDQTLVNLKNTTVEFEIETFSPICIETKDSSHRLSKFILRQNKSVLGCGVCKRIL